MADIYDVQTVLTALASDAIYPYGINAPSIINQDVRIYPGWPIPDTLDNDLANMVSHISIFPTSMSRSTTRFDTSWQESIANEVTLFFEITATTVTVTGSVTVPQTVLMRMNGYDYSYVVQENDTLDSVALNISLLVPGAYSIGNVIKFVIVRQIEINVSTSGTAVREVARESRILYMSVWSPTPQIRETLLNALQVAVAANNRVVLPDNYYANISFEGSNEFDLLEKVNCYRNDLLIQIDYAITQSLTAYTVAQNIVDVNSVAISPAILFQLLSGGNFLLLNTQNLALLE